jgi:protein-tyrosine phosphatase
MSASDYRILTVCTGNVCRSPLIERLLTARLRDQLSSQDATRFEISSAGTGAMVGDPMTPDAAELLRSLGGDPDGFVSRDLGAAMLDESDLILTATREHRGLVVTQRPSALSRTLTLRELARLLRPVTPVEIDERVTNDDPVERMRAIVAAALANRGLVAARDPADDDIADPYGRARSAYERAASEIDAAVRVVTGLLFSRSPAL